MPRSTEIHNPWRTKPPPLCPRPQFDQDTGSMMSGVYDPERSPSIVFSAQGIDGEDLERRPGNFARSYPHANAEFDENTFFQKEEALQRTREWLISSTASTARVFHSVSHFDFHSLCC
jgi:hypothetical protein